MPDHLVDDLLPVIGNDPRVEAVAADADGLILRIDGELLRIAADPEHGRTVCWAEVCRLLPGDAAAGAAAARRYNGTMRTETNLTMGLNAARNVLILGGSMDVREIDAVAAVQAGLKVREALDGARALLDSVLEEARGTKGPQMQAFGQLPLVRV